MIGQSRLNIGDLVSDHTGHYYILIEVLEPKKGRYLSHGAPWRYVVRDGLRTCRFKEHGLFLVRKK
jgi:hypothetical protein